MTRSSHRYGFPQDGKLTRNLLAPDGMVRLVSSRRIWRATLSAPACPGVFMNFSSRPVIVLGNGKSTRPVPSFIQATGRDLVPSEPIFGFLVYVPFLRDVNDVLLSYFTGRLVPFLTGYPVSGTDFSRQISTRNHVFHVQLGSLRHVGHFHAENRILFSVFSFQRSCKA